ncbi:MAG TPA: hypothetical protein ENK39_05135 [Epsilonproteobacteria bacterium]|nr:hypothetical protein [Campylobacterota bacterium]
MKKINFIVILLTFIVSIVTVFYINVLSELIGKQVFNGSLVIVKQFDIFGIILVTIVLAILPSWVLAYAYIRMKTNVWWVIFIGIIYTLIWVGLSTSLFGAYMEYFRDTWSWHSSAIDFTFQQDYFYLAYFLSLIPMIVLGVFNEK